MEKSVKYEVEALLKRKDYDSLLKLCQTDKKAFKALRMNLYSADDDLSWPTIEAIARLMRLWWQAGEEESVREFIRGLFWSLNDESGGIGWNAPQTIAEIIVLIPELIEPYGSMMIDRTMEEPLLINSGLWAIGRLGEPIKPAVTFFQDLVMGSFDSDNPQTLGLAAWAMGQVGFMPALPVLKMLERREEPARIYINGVFYDKPLGQWAQEAIDLICTRQ